MRIKLKISHVNAFNFNELRIQRKLPSGQAKILQNSYRKAQELLQQKQQALVQADK